MTKKIIISVVLIFIAWSAMDFVIHGIILKPYYEKTAQLWRPMNEMKMWLMRLVTLISAVVFVVIYAKFFGIKNLFTGFKYGLIFGIGYGISMGYGSYSVMPIPYYMALTWFLGTTAEGIVAGLVTGAVVKE